MRYLGAKTKREAVVAALSDFNRRNRMAALASTLGTFKEFITPAELRRQREGR